MQQLEREMLLGVLRDYMEIFLNSQSEERKKKERDLLLKAIFSQDTKRGNTQSIARRKKGRERGRQTKKVFHTQNARTVGLKKKHREK